VAEGARVGVNVGGAGIGEVVAVGEGLDVEEGSGVEVPVGERVLVGEGVSVWVWVGAAMGEIWFD
jgi:hypothetical protein